VFVNGCPKDGGEGSKVKSTPAIAVDCGTTMLDLEMECLGELAEVNPEPGK
jgi:hypothetical protein